MAAGRIGLTFRTRGLIMEAQLGGLALVSVVVIVTESVAWSADKKDITARRTPVKLPVARIFDTMPVDPSLLDVSISQ